jgi:hypothetical protein
LVVQSGELRRLQAQLRQTVAQFEEVGAAGVQGGTAAAAGLGRVRKAASEVATARVHSAAVSRRAAQQELAALQAIARTSKRGSAEQIEANRLAAASARRLGLQQVESAHLAAAGWRRDERQLGALARGAAAASGVFSRFGRSIAFGSFAFLGGAAVIDQLKTTATAAEQAERAQKGLETQLDSAGISFGRFGARIERVIRAQSRLAGVDDEEVKRSLTTLIRGTGDLNNAYRLNALALDIAAAKHIQVEQAATALAKAYNGQTGALSRLIGGLPKGVSGLEAIRVAQQRFAGQAKAAGSTAGAGFERLQNSIKNIRESFGEGFAPVLTRDLNELAAKLDDPGLERGAKKLGERIGKDLDSAVRDVAGFVERNWPHIEKDFRLAERALRDSAKFAGLLERGLEGVASIVPGGGGTIVDVLVAGVFAKRIEKVIGRVVTLGKDLVALGPAAAEGAAVADAALATIPAGGFATTPAGGARGGGRKSGSRIANLVEGATVGGVAARGLQVGKGIGRRFWPIAATLAAFDALGARRTGSVPHRIAQTLSAAASGASLGLIPAFDQEEPQLKKRLHDAIKSAVGGGVDDAHFGERITSRLQDAQKAAENAAAGFDTAFKRVRDTALQAFDQQTSQMLDRFDQATQRMEDKLRVTVKVAGEVFTIGKNEKTPAERELDALDKLQSRRTFQRDIFDAKQNLAQAQLVGDPTQIRAAQRAVQDAEAEKRRFGLEQRAQRERAAADAAQKAAEAKLATRRAGERGDLVGRRRQLRSNLQAELGEELKAFEKGRVNAAGAQQRLLATLRRFHVDYKHVGAELGGAFANTFKAQLAAVNKAVGTLEKKLKQATKAAQTATRDASVLSRALGVNLDQPIPTGPITALENRLHGTAQRQQRERDIQALLGLHPTHKRIETAFGAVGLDPRRIPFNLNAAGLRKLGAGLPLGALEDLLYYLRHNRIRPPQHFATGGVVEGPAGRDQVLARLTRGELVLNEPQQVRLKTMLGVTGTAKTLFRHVRGYATGGVVDGDSRLDRFLRELERLLGHVLVRQTRLTQAEKRLIGVPGAKPLTLAQRRLLEPVSIEALVNRDPRTRRLPAAQRERLESMLAQAEAHPRRAGLIVHTPTGIRAGLPHQLPRNQVGIPAGAFTGIGPVTINVHEASNPQKTAREVLSHMRRLAKGNARGFARTGTRRTGSEARPQNTPSRLDL